MAEILFERSILMIIPDSKERSDDRMFLSRYFFSPLSCAPDPSVGDYWC
jgi:hypothetical protein